MEKWLFLDGKSRSANALAQEKCEVITINSADFLNILKNNFQVSMNLLEELAVRLRKSDQQIEALSLSDAEHRIGVSILNIAEDMGVIKNGVVTISIFLINKILQIWLVHLEKPFQEF